MHGSTGGGWKRNASASPRQLPTQPFSALHELVGPAIGSTRSWQVDPRSLLARLCAAHGAAGRGAAVGTGPDTAARREHEARSLVQVRRDHRLIAVAQAALMVRQLSEDRRHGRRQTARLRRARRRLQRAHVTALRMTGVGPDLFEVLAAVGAVDILPAATIPTGRSGTQPDIRGAQVPAVLALSDTLSDTSAVLAGGVDTGLDTLDGDPSGAIALSDIPTGGPDSLGAQVPAVLTLSDTLSDTSAVLAGGVDTGA